ncbi:hypothetical protein QOZ80_3BG0262750 [Eleusine coracana subsp. coracana]|nr:hypothetical protein QOZ80_3BG0262750 [Eleusine coracana subsp. coracana]
MAASMNFSLAAAVLLSGLLILGAVQATEAVVACPPSIMCAQGSYVTCANMPGQYFNGCDCWYVLSVSAIEVEQLENYTCIIARDGATNTVVPLTRWMRQRVREREERREDSGLLIMSAVEPSDAAGVCSIMCAQGTYVTCANRPGQNFTGRCACDQQCAPPGCGGCRAHLGDVSTAPVRG